MHPKLKLFSTLLAILLIAAACMDSLTAGSSRISLNKLKIPYSQTFKVHLGLDLQGGSRLVYQADFSGIAQADQADALNAIRDTIERRVNSFGVSEPVVQVSGNNQITIELPGIKDINDAINQIGKPRIWNLKPRRTLTLPARKLAPAGALSLGGDDQWVSTGLSGKQLSKASVDLQQGGSLSNQVVVRLQFDSDGAKLFSQITWANIGKPIAIFLDGQLLSAPTVQSAITDGTAVITGNFTISRPRI